MSRRIRLLPQVGSRWFSLALLAATVLMVLAVLAGATGAADAASPSEKRKFDTRVIGNFKGAALATGVTVPTGAGFGETAIAAHKCDFSFFSAGSLASAGVQALAEDGSISAFETAVEAAVDDNNAQEFWKINPPNGPGKGKGGPSIQIEDDFGCLTILVKINPTSDWFAGVSALDLRAGGSWPTPDEDNFIFIDLFPFDAGTLDGTEFVASSTATSPQSTIASLRNTGKFNDTKIAQLRLKLKDPALTKGVAAEEAIESIIVTWAEVVAAGGYHVMWKSGAEAHDTDGSLGRRDVVVGGRTRTHTITGLTGGVEHEVQVIAYNEAGQSSQTPTSESKDRTTPISAATAGNTVLVGNTTQRIPGTERLTIGPQYPARAQAFTTGSESAVLGSVTLPEFRKENSNSLVDVHIYSASGVDPGAELYTLTRPDFSSFSSGVPTDITFNAAAADTITLAINTTYFVVVEAVQGQVGLAHTKDDDEDPATDEGWSIANTCRREYGDGTPISDCERTGSSTAALIMVLNSPLAAGKPVLSISGSEAVEGTGIQFTVSLSPALGEEVTVEYSTADDSATTADSDYTAVTASTLTFAANETEKTVTITTGDDSTDEDDENFNVELSSPSENAQLGYVTSASGLIINNDQTTQTDGTLSSITLTGSDGDTIALTPAFNQYKFLYTATADRELDSLTGVAVPSTTGTVQSIVYVGGNEDTVTTAYDAVWPLVPGDTLVKFMVISPDGSRTKIYKIHVDKDAATDATLESLSLVDSTTNSPVALTLSPAFDPATTVYTASVGPAVTSVTLTGIQNHNGATISNNRGPVLTSGEATVGPWAGETVINFDLTAEDGSTTKTYTVTAERLLTVNFDSAAYSVNEGGSVQVSVSLNGVPGNEVRANLSTTLQGATTADFGGVPGFVAFTGTDLIKTFDFVALTDIPSDPGESVKIELSPNSMFPGLLNGSPDETVVSIGDIVTQQLVAVDFGQSTYSVNEGASVEITITLATAASGQVTIPLTITPEDGAILADYSVPSSVTFDSGDTSQTIAFSATLDADTDPGESVKIELGTLPTGYAAGATTETTVSIIQRSVVVNFGAALYAVDEDQANEHGEVQISVTLNQALGSDITIPLTATGQAGATFRDYKLPNPASVTFTAGQTQQMFTFTSKKDDVDDDGESVKIAFDTLPAGVSAGTTAPTTVVNILDDDHPSIDLSFSSGAYEVTEGSDMDLTLELTAPPERSISIRMQVYPQGDATIDDVSIAPTTIGFGANQVSATFVFTASHDTINEDNDVIKLEPDLGLPGGVGLGMYFVSFVTIIDDDDPSVTVSFDQSSYTVDESNDPDTGVDETKTTIKVKLSADPERTVEIPVYATVQGGASSTDDYSISPTVSTMPATPTLLPFNAGDTEKSFTFTATDDALNDDGESVLLRIGSTLPTGVTLETDGQATVSIIDDDDPPVTVSFELDAYSVAEGGSVDVKVKLSADPERTVSITITRSNNGAVDADYSGVPMTVSFASGETEKTITFAAIDDSFNDDDETVTLGFTSSLPEGVTAGTTANTTVSIDDNDFPEVTVSFELGSYTVAESDDLTTSNVEEHKVTVKVSLSADPERTVVIPLSPSTVLPLATDDYTGVPPNLTFLSGETEKTFTFTAVHDSDDDDGGKLTLTMAPLPDGVSNGARFAAFFYITDDDDPPVNVSISSSLTTVVEGANATITVSLDADPERVVIIPITKTHQGGALENDDYSGIPDTVTFTDMGPTSQLFTFQAVDDTDDDDDESVTFGFGMLPDGVTAGTANDVMISITDNDVPEVNVYFEHDTYSATENSSVTVKLKLSAAPERNLTITLTPENLGGALVADYSGIPAIVAFGPTDTENTFSFTATDDSADDDGESVKITLETTDARVSFGDVDGDNAATTINITDDDFPTLTVNFEQSSYTVAESDDPDTSGVEENIVTVTVKLSAPPERQVTIDMPISTDSTASSGDYTTVTSVTFEKDQTEQTFDFTATHDTIDDEDESVTFGFSSSLPTGISPGEPAETEVSIIDDDVPDVTVMFDQSSYDAPENGTITVFVVLSKAPQREVTIPLTATAQGGATEGVDYTAVDPSVTFSATEMSKTVDFTALSDTLSDDGESVKIGFGLPLPAGVTATSPTETTVTIIDNIVDVVAQFEQATYTADEGATVTIKVKLDVDPERMISIPLTVTGGGGEPGETGATADDYADFPASVNFVSGDTEKTFTFTVKSDDVDDDDENLLIEFGTLPGGVTAGPVGAATVNIIDDDDPVVTVYFDSVNSTFGEGDTAAVIVRLSADPERTVVIPLTASVLDGASPADYELPTPASVTFIAGDVLSKTFEFLVVDDDEDDDGESVKLGFGTIADDRVSASSPTETTVAITDNDHPFVKVSFSHAMQEVAEGASVNLTVSVDVDPERSLTIPLSPTYDGGATLDDHSVVPDSVTLSTDTRSVTIAFMAIDDSEDDDEDQVIIGFGDMPDDRVSAGDVPSTEITITDDDDPQVMVMFGAETYTVLEGGETTVTVLLSADPERTVTIPLNKTPKGDISESDYDGVPTSVEFISGAVEATFRVTASMDEEDDDDESIDLSFGALPEGVTAAAPATTNIAVVDGNVPDVTVKIEASATTVGEGESVTVTVKLEPAPERAVTVPLTYTYSDGLTALEFTADLPNSVAFESTVKEVAFTLNAVDDTDDDDDESLTIGFGTLPSKVSAGSPSQTTIAIIDDDDPEVTVSFEHAAYTIPEGENDAIKVKLSADPERHVEITLVFTTEEVGATDDDYVLDPDPGMDAFTVEFESGVTEQSFTFKSLTDNDDDDGETVTITFADTVATPLPNRVEEGTTNEAIVTIKPRPRVTPGVGGGGGGGGGPPPAAVPSEADFEWNVTRDIDMLDQDNDLPTDLWSDGQTIWVLNNAGSGADAIFAYDVVTGERKATSEFTLDSRNRFSHGIWSDGDTVWIADSGQDQLFAYDLASGERQGDSDLSLHEDNRDPRGIWSDGDTIYVLDSVKDVLFAYDLDSGTYQAQYALVSLNSSPRGVWSDGVTFWISDDSAKRIFAYRMEDGALRRIEAEEFTYQPLLKAGNGNPRGIWSDRDVVFVADEQDDRVYTYNMPESVNPSLSALTLSDINFGLFSSSRMTYTAVLPNGTTVTTIEATPTLKEASVEILPGDIDAEPENGHQAKVEDGSRIKVMVTSLDGDRTNEYTVEIKQCLSGLNGYGLGTVQFIGGSLSELEACARDLSYSAIYHYRDGVWAALFLGAPEFLNQPFRNRFAGGIGAGAVLIGKRVPASASTTSAAATN